MGNIKKSTKKFNKKHLGNDIKKRKKFKHSHKNTAAPKSKHTNDNANEKEGGKSSGVEAMSLDEFLDGGFEDVLSGTDDEDELEGEDSGSEISDDPADGLEAELGDENDEEADSDGEGAADEAVITDNKRLRGEVASHRSQLEALRQKDPEFFAYLQANDSALLDFQDDDDDEGEPDEQDDEEDDEEEKAAAPAVKVPASSRSVTSAVVTMWMKAIREQAALGSMEHCVRAYRLACHYGDSEEQIASGMKISSSAVFNTLMMFMLKEADGVFRRQLGLETKTNVTVADVTGSARWKKVGPMVKSYLGNTLHLLGSMTDAAMLAFTLRRLRASVVFLGPFAKLQRKTLKAFLGLFGSADAGPRVQAFLGVRAMALGLPHPCIDYCMKGVYKTFVANAKFMSATSAPHIHFMATCVIELFGCDMNVAYQHAFAAIRQLALALRAALSTKTADAYKQLYSWQAVNCLELWCRLLAAHADKPELRALVFPLAQLVTGTARLLPSPRYFPLRLRLARALNGLARDTGLFIPVAPILMEMLHWSELSRPPRGGAGALPDLGLQLRVSKNTLTTSSFQEEVVLQVMDLLAEHLAQWSCSIAFPELSHLPILQLRKFAKKSPVERFRKNARQLIEVVERNAAWVGNARSQVEFSPKDVDQVSGFLSADFAACKAPLQGYASGLQAKAQQRRALQAASQVTMTSKGRKGEDSEDEAEDDEEQLSDEEEGEEEDGSEEENEEEEAPAARKPARKAAVAAAMVEDDGDGSDAEIFDMDPGEDVLEDFVLSDDDGDDHRDGPALFEDDDDSDDDSDGGKPKKKHGHTGGAAKQGGKGGKPGKGFKQKGPHKRPHSLVEKAGSEHKRGKNVPGKNKKGQAAKKQKR